MKEIHKYSSGNFFTPNAKFFGYIFILFSIGLIFWTFHPQYSGYSKIIIALIFLPLPLYSIFTNYGVEINYRNKTIQNYKKLMGFNTKKGELKTIKYNYVTVFSLHRTYSMQTRANMRTSVSESLYSISLVSDNYKRKLEILGTEDKAYSLAQEIVNNLELEFT